MDKCLQILNSVTQSYVIFAVAFVYVNGEINSYCAPYQGSICSSYLSTTNSKLVWFENNTSSWANEQISKDLWNELNLKEPCRSAAKKLLCMYAFPECLLKDNMHNGLPLCYEDCIAVKEQFCYNVWALLEDNKKTGIFLQKRGHFRLPNCDILPKYEPNHKALKSAPTCSYAGVMDMRQEDITYECVVGNGRFYQGMRNVTRDDLPCQRWDTQEPHTHVRPPSYLPELQDAENYCRNAGGEVDRPWCFTRDPAVRWQYCDVPMCTAQQHAHSNSNVSTTDHASSHNNSLSRSTHPVLVRMDQYLTPKVLAVTCAVGLLALLVAVGSVVAGILLCRRRKRRRKRRFNRSNNRPSNDQRNSLLDIDIDLRKLPSNQAYHRTGAQLNPRLEQLEFPRNDIIYVRDLGQGAFGRVFQARAPGLVADEEFTLVAVKMLKDDATEDLQDDFEKEACLLAEFDHPNIVKLLGICAIGRPMCLLFEYMARGDLNEYLRQCSTQRNASCFMTKGDNTGDSSDGGEMAMSHLQQLNIALQIAAGMVYLSDRKFVHRDLATRNCLINENMVVKIADFGLSQKIYLQDYYKGDEHDAIPVRWMPLESILYNKYTAESDVWAFGVCVWEIFTFALQPYYGMTHEEVVRYLKAGHVLPAPEHAPPAIYELMRRCWAARPQDRPPFRALHHHLQVAAHQAQLVQQQS